jgi:hypothetical protein
MAPTYDYDVAVSFADEDRVYVLQVVRALQRRGLRVFYDADHSVELWGRDLAAEFDSVFRHRSEYVIVFISTAYVRREWTRHELRSALARSVKERRGNILPVRFDRAELPGLTDTIRFIDAATVTPVELAEKIADRVGQIDQH